MKFLTTKALILCLVLGVTVITADYGDYIDYGDYDYDYDYDYNYDDKDDDYDYNPYNYDRYDHDDYDYSRYDYDDDYDYNRYDCNPYDYDYDYNRYDYNPYDYDDDYDYNRYDYNPYDYDDDYDYNRYDYNRYDYNDDYDYNRYDYNPYDYDDDYDYNRYDYGNDYNRYDYNDYDYNPFSISGGSDDYLDFLSMFGEGAGSWYEVPLDQLVGEADIGMFGLGLLFMPEVGPQLSFMGCSGDYIEKMYISLANADDVMFEVFCDDTISYVILKGGMPPISVEITSDFPDSEGGM